MKNTVMAAVVIALAASLSGVAHAEKSSHGKSGPRGHNIQSLDTNGDGAVSRAEFEAGALVKATKFFEKLDTNRDGVLTKADRRDRTERGGPKGKGGDGRGLGGDNDGQGKPWKHHDREHKKERSAE